MIIDGDKAIKFYEQIFEIDFQLQFAYRATVTPLQEKHLRELIALIRVLKPNCYAIKEVEQ